jgi:hypothetical protein
MENVLASGTFWPILNTRNRKITRNQITVRIRTISKYIDVILKFIKM